MMGKMVRLFRASVKTPSLKLRSSLSPRGVDAQKRLMERGYYTKQSISFVVTVMMRTSDPLLGCLHE